MGREEIKTYCDRGEGESFFQTGRRGRTLYYGVAYPTADSHGQTACSQALSVGRESFLRRPSLCDEALRTISGFINQDIYRLQEPRKVFLCNTAQLFVKKGMARFLVSGEACIYHVQDGRLKHVSTFQESVFGEKITWKAKLEEIIDISAGKNTFLLYSGKSIPDFQAAVGEEVQAEELFCLLQKGAGSAAVVMFPQRVKNRF